MAIMCPDTPKEFDKYSFEDLAFSALEKLPDDYYVFHSFSIVNVSEGTIDESETDFIVFNQNLGILCIEAKAGLPEYRNNRWYYGSGIPMKHDGPFRQASRRKHGIIDLLIQSRLGDIAKRCKFVHAVWFISVVDKSYFDNKTLPEEAPLELILTQESENDLDAAIKRIFSLETRFETSLSNKDKDILLNRVLAPQFGTISLAEYRRGHEKVVFKALLKEQVALLEYLEEQNNAIINGLAGTGKTVMAKEKALRHADKGEKVLFLCYNSKLKEYLSRSYPHENIDYYTIGGFACSKCGTPTPDYRALRAVLEDYYCEGTFPYQHIVIDEGQDFGRDELTGRENKSETDIIELLKLIMLDNDSDNHSFYVFYDKNQMVQSLSVPEYIREADCKLTLYKNCRNTINIAETSLRLLNNPQRLKMYEGAAMGTTPSFAVCPDEESFFESLNKTIEQLWEKHINDIQILTCKTLTTSLLSRESMGENYQYKGVKIPFSTCRKFKGLEADAVILIDVDMDSLKKDENKLGYVGASRARHELAILVSLNEQECRFLLEQLDRKPGKNPMKTLAAQYNSKLFRIE